MFVLNFTGVYMITGDNKPGNINTNELDLNNGGWIIIGVLIGIIIVLLVVLIVKCLKSDKKINNLQSLLKNEINDKEMDMILTYRTLNTNDKEIVRDTLKSLSNNHNDTD